MIGWLRNRFRVRFKVMVLVCKRSPNMIFFTWADRLNIIYFSRSVILLCSEVAIMLSRRAAILIIMGKRIEKGKYKTAAQGDEDRNLPGCVWNKLISVSMPFICAWLMVKWSNNVISNYVFLKDINRFPLMLDASFIVSMPVCKVKLT